MEERQKVRQWMWCWICCQILSGHDLSSEDHVEHSLRVDPEVQHHELVEYRPGVLLDVVHRPFDVVLREGVHDGRRVVAIWAVCRLRSVGDGRLSLTGCVLRPF